MKVIKVGSGYKSNIRKTKCGECKSELEYTSNDTIPRRISYDETEYIVFCPICRKEVTVY